MTPTPDEIVFHHDVDYDVNPWVHGGPVLEDVIEVVPYDPVWSVMYEKLIADILVTLGQIALHVEHIGSTSVSGLAAKPVIDIDLTVPDPTDETRYVPALERLGYIHTIREPNWHEHRCLQLVSPRVNLHVFGPNCPELVRHRLFRDWLRDHPEDCRRYEQAKYKAVPGASDVMAYNERKQPIIRDIYDKAFKAAGYL